MSRIRNLLAARKRRTLLIPFFTSGYPTRAASVDLVKLALDAGADMVELGMPFSDPMADGPEIQFSSQIALNRGHTMPDLIRTVNEVRAYSKAPLILMGYYNPVLAFGVETFATTVAEAGGDGLIIPDLPVEEASELAHPAEKAGLSMVYLVAPTSSCERIATVDRKATDLVYAVTVTGVTGGRTGFQRDTVSYLKSLMKQLTKPFVAGFGVSSPETARQLAKYADGVVIGSALIHAFRTASNRKAGYRAVEKLLTGIRKNLDR